MAGETPRTDYHRIIREPRTDYHQVRREILGKLIPKMAETKPKTLREIIACLTTAVDLMQTESQETGGAIKAPIILSPKKIHEFGGSEGYLFMSKDVIGNPCLYLRHPEYSKITRTVIKGIKFRRDVLFSAEREEGISILTYEHLLETIGDNFNKYENMTDQEISDFREELKSPLHCYFSKEDLSRARQNAEPAESQDSE